MSISLELVEREADLALGARVLAAARGGDGAAVLVEGEAGVGKTTLLAAIGVRARAEGMLVLRARASPLEGDFAFGVLRSLLTPAVRALDPERRAELLRGPVRAAALALGLASRGREAPVEPTPALLDAVFWLVEGLTLERPVLLVVDDLQWADAASVRALAYVAHRAPTLPLVLAVALRAGEPTLDPAATAALRAASAHRLAPAPLSVVGTAALAREHSADGVAPEDLHVLTGGNPFLVLELVDALERAPRAEGRIPPGAARAVALNRLAGTSPEARTVARAVAILGDGAHVGEVAAWCDLDAEGTLLAAAELARARLFADAAELAFAHPLLAEAVRGAASEHERAAEHLRAARVLRALHEPDPQRIALHLARSAPVGDAAAVEELRAAAAQALQRGAPETAVAHLERALAEPPPAPERPRVSVELGLAELAARRHADGLPRLEVTLDDPAWPAEVAAAAAWARMAGGGFPDVIAALLRGARARAGDDALWLTATADWAASFLPTGLRPAIDLPSPAALGPDRRGERMGLAAWLQRGLNAGSGLTSAALPDLALRALADGELARDGLSYGMALASAPLLGLLHAEALDPAEAQLGRVERLVRERAAAGGIAATMLPRTYLDLLRGNAAAAAASSASALELLQIVEGESRATASAFVAAVHVLALLAGEGAEAAELALAEHGLDGELSPVQVWVLPARAHVHLALGRAAAALADASAWSAGAEAMGRPMSLVELSLIEPLALAATGRTALPAAEAVLARERAWGAPGRVAATLRMLAVVEPERALEHLDEASELAAVSPLPLERAQVSLARGIALRRAGQRTAAREELEQALQLAARCTAATLVARARGELHVLGARPRRLAFDGIDSLTRAERRVVDLAAGGLTNRAIAQELFVTVKTVDSHLTSAFRKLGVSRRTELSATLAS